MIGVVVLGSTGSIGDNTLDVLSRHRDRFRVVGLAANRNAAKLAEQVIQWRPDYAALADESAARELTERLSSAGVSTRVMAGPGALTELAALPEAPYVMAAIVGSAGLRSTLAAARAGKRLLLANKESLVMAGPLLMAEVRAHGATLLPVDSEHSAIFQCLPRHAQGTNADAGIRRVMLTASGGPFLDWPREALASATPEQACAHPNWVMGRKISVDSATLMNKGLELIEACLLFDLAPSRVDVVVHPQSIVHSFVEYLDGSMLAQLGNPDMRTPIAHALGWPERLSSGVESLDIIRTARLDFEAPDTTRFPCLRLARSAAEAGGTSPAVLNAANEIAVEAFLERRLAFADIPAVIERVLERHRTGPVVTLEDVLSADEWARREARAAVALAGACA